MKIRDLLDTNKYMIYEIKLQFFLLIMQKNKCKYSLNFSHNPPYSHNIHEGMPSFLYLYKRLDWQTNTRLGLWQKEKEERHYTLRIRPTFTSCLYGFRRAHDVFPVPRSEMIWDRPLATGGSSKLQASRE